jgi:hypothetical protein
MKHLGPSSPAALALLALAAACASSPAPPTATAAAPAAAPPATGAAPANTLRAPEAILADAVAATGGAAAWNAHRTARFQIDTVFQGMGMGGSGERFLTRAGKTLVVTTLAGLGTVREGGDGKRFWSQDPLQGFRFLDGVEEEQARIEASWNADLEAKTLFVKLASATEPGPDGAPLECVIATPKLGPPIHSCYDRATHLEVLQTGVRATPQGDVPFRAVTRDWHTVGGVKIPFEAETQVGPITLLVHIKSLVFDEPMDDKMFEPPVPPAAK